MRKSGGSGKKAKTVSRTPSAPIRRALRVESGFGCAIPDCANPFLEFHHFDPPWKVEHHHRPEGMIALCAEHHKQADGGAYTNTQLIEFKQGAKNSSAQVSARFNWLRNELLVTVGGGFYLDCPIIFQYRGKPVISYRRDGAGHFLMNVNMISTGSEPRLVMEDNCWVLRGDPTDMECPPHGRLLKLKYPNGDYLQIEFYIVKSASDLDKKYPDASLATRLRNVRYPITACEVHYALGGTDIKFGPRTTVFGGATFHNPVLQGLAVGYSLI